jgi:hypothetical protein
MTDRDTWEYALQVISSGVGADIVLDQFNALGLDGWELVTIFNGGRVGAVAVFIRGCDPEEDEEAAE